MKDARGVEKGKGKNAESVMRATDKLTTDSVTPKAANVNEFAELKRRLTL